MEHKRKKLSRSQRQESKILKQSKSLDDFVKALKRYRNQPPKQLVHKILMRILEFLNVDNNIRQELKTELMKIIEDIVRNCYEDREWGKESFYLCKEIFARIKTHPPCFEESQFPSLSMKKFSKSGADDSSPIKEFDLLGEENLSILDVKDLGRSVINQYKAKWDNERDLTQSSKELQKIIKFESEVIDLALDTLNEFVEKYDELDEKDKALSAVGSMLQRIRLDTNDESEMGLAKSLPPIPSIELTDPKFISDFKGFVDMEIAAEIASAVSSVPIENDRRCYINFNQIWNKNSRWLGLKYKFLQKGFNKSGDIYFCYPIFRQEFELATGSFGKVELGFSKNFHGIAVRRLTQHGVVPEICIDLVRRVGELSKVSHPHLLKSNACRDMCGYTFFYNKLCEYNLSEYVTLMNDKHQMNDELVTRIGYQIARGLQALHLNNPSIVHGNLKPSNVFIDENGLVKLAEFGLFRNFAAMEKHNEIDKIWWPSETHMWYKLLKSYTCTVMSDIQSCGILFHYIKTGGRHPYGLVFSEIIENLENRKFVLDSKSLGLDLFSLLVLMLDPNPQQRPNIVEVINNIYFWDDSRKREFLNHCLIQFNLDPKFEGTLSTTANREPFKQLWNSSICNRSANFLVIPKMASDNITELLKKLSELKMMKCETRNGDGEEDHFEARAESEAAVLMYNAILGTVWFQKNDLRNFCPHNVIIR